MQWPLTCKVKMRSFTARFFFFFLNKAASWQAKDSSPTEIKAEMLKLKFKTLKRLKLTTSKLSVNKSLKSVYGPYCSITERTMCFLHQNWFLQTETYSWGEALIKLQWETLRKQNLGILTFVCNFLQLREFICQCDSCRFVHSRFQF